MVTRKPLSSNPVPQPLRQAANNPPYPTESTMPSMDEAGADLSYPRYRTDKITTPEGSDQRSRASSIASVDTWNTDPSEPDVDETRTGGLPESLTPGPKHPSNKPPAPNGSIASGELQSSASVWRENSYQRSPPSLQSQNPYLNTSNAGQPPPYDRPASKHSQYSQQSAFSPPSDQLASLMLDSSSLDHHNAAPSHAPPPPPNDDFAAPAPSPLAPTLVNVQAPATAPLAPPFPAQNTGSHSSTHSNPWQDDLDREQEKIKTRSLESAIEVPTIVQPPSLLDQPQTPVQAPSLPLRLDNISNQSIGRPEVETPRAQARRQRGESYNIKHVRWFDASADGGRGSLRTSPILTQSNNGPCPILALVNTLSLSTPDHEDSALVDALKSREQVTLGLLLDAVFEELVRRNENTGNELPDIGDLYSFLITLHTGMNVNPSFTKQLPSQPGGFEQTKEMQLYGAFHIPLVHGWIPPPDSETYQAFERSAKTFDEALNVQFLEEEFNSKLQAGGLSRDEQQVFQDLTAVKEFLMTYPTQLSNDGLEVLNSWMTPGRFAILFRNDHFCTLYREPKNGTLMTLVTDTGYSTHDEIVWESLVDVNGAMAEFYSGDYRPVGTSRQPSSTRASEAPWQTSESKHHRSSSYQKGMTSTTSLTSPVSPAQSRAEQEDLDLALALQLQEEEEEASRREEARRQDAHNESLSRQYLDQQSFDQPEQRPAIPPRRSPRSTSTNVIQATPNAQTQQAYNSSSRTDDGNAPPPTYEQAASDPIYREAGSTPQPPRQGNALGALSALGVQGRQTAFGAQGSQQTPPSYGRRPSNRLRTYSASPTQQGMYGQSGQAGRYNDDERCIIM